MAVDIEFAGNLSRHENRHHNFRLSLKRTGEVTRIFANIVDHNRLPAGGRSSTDALVQRNSGVRGHGAYKGVQHQHGRLGAGFEHVEANPVVLQHALV